MEPVHRRRSRDTPEYRRALAEETALVDAAELVSTALERKGRTRAWLAKQLRVRPSEITQRLSGTRNVTLRSLAAMLSELGYNLELNAADSETGDLLDDHRDAATWSHVEFTRTDVFIVSPEYTVSEVPFELPIRSRATELQPTKFRAELWREQGEHLRHYREDKIEVGA